jgi:hypothetical protein
VEERANVLFDAGTKEILALLVLVVCSNDVSHCIAIIRAITVCIREGRWW